MEALSQTFVVAFPEIQQVANERGCRPILDMPFYERSGRKLVPLKPDCVIDQLEKLEYLDGFMAQHRFCVEGERHLETKDGWVWFPPSSWSFRGRGQGHAALWKCTQLGFR